MIIREAREEDYDAICSLIEQIDRIHRENLPHIFQEAQGTTRQREYILGLIEAQNIGAFVVEVESKPVAFISIIARMSTDIPVLVSRCFAVIENLVVDEEYRRLGIGTALLQHAQRWASKMGAERIELNVYGFNRGAKKFYEQFGFTTESRRMSKEITRKE